MTDGSNQYKKLSLSYLTALSTFGNACCGYGNQNDFADAVRQTFQSYRGQMQSALANGRNGRPFGLDIDISPNWNTPITRKVCGAEGIAYLHLGGKISFRDGVLFSQSLTACITFDCSKDSPNNEFESEKTYLVRKFHFDFDPQAAGGRWPIKHLQVGGKLNEIALNIDSEVEKERFNQIDVPRLPYPILDIASLAHMFINSCGADQAIGMTRETFWKKSVRSFEKIWQKEYYKKALEHLDKEESQETIYELFSKPISELI